MEFCFVKLFFVYFIYCICEYSIRCTTIEGDHSKERFQHIVGTAMENLVTTSKLNKSMPITSNADIELNNAKITVLIEKTPSGNRNIPIGVKNPVLSDYDTFHTENASENKGSYQKMETAMADLVMTSERNNDTLLPSFPHAEGESKSANEALFVKWNATTENSSLPVDVNDNVLFDDAVDSSPKGIGNEGLQLKGRTAMADCALGVNNCTLQSSTSSVTAESKNAGEVLFEKGNDAKANLNVFIVLKMSDDRKISAQHDMGNEGILVNPNDRWKSDRNEESVNSVSENSADLNQIIPHLQSKNEKLQNDAMSIKLVNLMENFGGENEEISDHDDRHKSDSKERADTFFKNSAQLHLIISRLQPKNEKDDTLNMKVDVENFEQEKEEVADVLKELNFEVRMKCDTLHGDLICPIENMEVLVLESSSYTISMEILQKYITDVGNWILGLPQMFLQSYYYEMLKQFLSALWEVIDVALFKSFYFNSPLVEFIVSLFFAVMTLLVVRRLYKV